MIPMEELVRILKGDSEILPACRWTKGKVIGKDGKGWYSFK